MTLEDRSQEMRNSVSEGDSPVGADVLNKHQFPGPAKLRRQSHATRQDVTNTPLASSLGRNEILGSSSSLSPHDHYNAIDEDLEDDGDRYAEEDEAIGRSLRRGRELQMGVASSESTHLLSTTGAPSTQDAENDTTSLIYDSTAHLLQSIDDIQDEVTFWPELVSISINSFPLIITFFLQNSLSVASIMSIGHLGSTELAGITLGSMTANVTSFSIVSGISTCLDTLCSQAFGAGKYHLISLYFQRCNALLLLIIMPIIVFYFAFGFKFLYWITEDSATSDFAAQYLKIISLGLPGYCLFETGKRYLQSQGIFHASTYVLFVCAPINALLNYVLVWDPIFGIGYSGAPLAVAITYWLMPLGLLVYILKAPSAKALQDCWKFYPVRKIAQNFTTLLHLAAPSLIMIEAEFLAFEFMTIFASKLSVLELAAQSCIASVSALSWQLIFAISVAASTRVANYLGAGKIHASKVCCQISYLFAILVSILNCAALLIYRRGISYIFTSDSEIAEIVIAVMPTLALFQFVDSLNSVGAGCLRGQGLQKIGSIINLISYYVMGLPLSYFLTFNEHLGLKGLWLGTSFALLINSAVEIYYVFYSDWDWLYEQAKARNEENALV